MINIIGNKNLFAIEFEITEFEKFFFAHSRIWINNCYIGNYGDDCPIYGVYHYLNYLNSHICDFQTNQFAGMQSDMIYKTMVPYSSKEDYFSLSNTQKDNLSNYDKYIAGFNEAYDDFVIRCFIEEKQVCFLWKLQALSNKKQYPNYDDVVKLQKIQLNDFDTVVKKFEEKLVEFGVIKSTQ